MTTSLFHTMQELEHFRILIAVVVPLLGSGLAVASSILMPRGKAKGLVTGAYMLFASLGAGCLIFALAGVLLGMSRTTVGPFLLLGLVLTVVMGIFIPEVIREYQGFEVRKLAAEIFRRT